MCCRTNGHDVSTQTGSGTPCVGVYGPDGVAVAAGCAGFASSVAVGPVAIEAVGTHTIAVTDGGNEQVMTYAIDLQCVSVNCTQPTPLFAKAGIFRNGTWFLDNGNAQWDGCGVTEDDDLCSRFGLPGDVPVVGDWDGSGKTKVGVFRAGNWFLDNGNGRWEGCGTFPTQERCGSFGLPGDVPVVGDWDGSGVTKVGVYRNHRWFLDNGNLQWDGCGEFPTKDVCGVFGLPGDIPVVGRWSMFP